MKRYELILNGSIEKRSSGLISILNYVYNLVGKKEYYYYRY